MSGYYILDGAGQPVPASIDEWGKWLRSNRTARIIGRTEFSDGVRVSTVFLGLDHAWGGGPPLLFETMIFEGKWDQYQWRWHTRDEAVAAHLRILLALNAGEAPEGEES